MIRGLALALALSGCALLPALGVAVLDGAAGGTAYVIAEKTVGRMLDAPADAGIPDGG